MYVYLYIYIYKERERERDTFIYVYIYYTSICSYACIQYDMQHWSRTATVSDHSCPCRRL